MRGGLIRKPHEKDIEKQHRHFSGRVFCWHNESWRKKHALISTKRYLKMTATSHHRPLSSHRVPHKAGSSHVQSKGRVGNQKLFDYRQEQCLNALRIAQTNSELFTTALTSKILYGSGKFDDVALRQLLDTISQAMEIANDCTKANSCVLEKDSTPQDGDMPSVGFRSAEQQSRVPPSA